MKIMKSLKKKKIKQNNPAYAVIKSTGDNVSGMHCLG